MVAIGVAVRINLLHHNPTAWTLVGVKVMEMEEMDLCETVILQVLYPISQTAAILPALPRIVVLRLRMLLHPNHPIQDLLLGAIKADSRIIPNPLKKKS